MELALPLAFSIGLMSTLHCVGMCGGIMGALSYGLPGQQRDRNSRLLIYLLAYSSGRIASYAVAGALFGLIGTGLLEWLGDGPGNRLLQWFAGLFLVLIGLHIAGWLQRLAIIERLGAPVWRAVEPLARRMMPVTSPWQALVYGALWGWLPCGLVYTMLLASVGQGGVAGGALYMLAFGLGTLPAMLATGLLAGRLYQAARRQSLRLVIGLLIVCMGLYTLWNPDLLEQLSGSGGVAVERLNR